MRLVTIFAALVIAALSHGQLSGQGTLLDSAGAPVVGADVITSRRYPPDYKQIIYRTKTDSQGHFKLESISAKKLPDYALLFVKTRSGMVSLANESDSQGVWNLAPPVNYRFTVKDKYGKPLAKAMMKPHYFWVPAKPSGSIQADYPAESSRWDYATTGVDGTATFQGLGMEVTQFGSGEESGEVEVSCPGMADERVSVNKDKPSVTVTLNPGAILGGRLLDAHGRGVGGVDIRVKSDAASDVTITTDNTGAYSAKGLKPGVYDLEPLLGPLSRKLGCKADRPSFGCGWSGTGRAGFPYGPGRAHQRSHDGPGNRQAVSGRLRFSFKAGGVYRRRFGDHWRHRRLRVSDLPRRALYQRPIRAGRKR